MNLKYKCQLCNTEILIIYTSVVLCTVLLTTFKKGIILEKIQMAATKFFPILENGKMFAIFNLKKRQWVMI